MKRLIVFLMVFGLVFSGLSISDVTVSPDPILPGGYGSVTATIESTLSVTATGTVISGGQDVERVLIKIYTYGGAIESTTSEVNIGDLDAGASTQVSVPFKIKENAESGAYLLKLEAQGWVEVSGGGSTFSEKSATVSVNVLNLPLLSLEFEDSVVEEKGEVTLKIVNEGGDAKSLRITMSNGFAVEGKNEIYVGTVDKEKEVTFTLDASEADAGPNDVEFTLVYYDELGTERTETKTVRLNVIKEESVVNIIQNSGITSNTEGELNLIIKNKGKNIQDLKISFPNDDLKLKESDKIEVGSMTAGEQITVDATVFPVLNPGLTQVETLIEWKENGEQKSDIVKIPFTVSSDVLVGIYLEAKPSPLYTGQEHTLVVLVSNLGSYKINNVDVTVKSTDNFALLDVQPSEYIGEMSSDDFSTVQFKIIPMKGGLQNISLVVKYKDQSGEWITENITREVIVYESSADLGGLFWFVVFIAVIGAGIWYFKFRKKVNR